MCSPFPKAANENESNNYDKALKFEKNAQFLNIGGFIFLVTAGVLFILFITVGTTAASVGLSNSSGTSSSA